VTRLLTVAFSAALFAFLLAHEASAQRAGGIQTGPLRDDSFRAVSTAVFRPGLRARGYRGYHGYRAAAWGGRRSWRGGRRWYGYAGRPYLRYGAGAAALAGAGAYYYNSPGYSQPRASGSTDVEAYRAPGTCGTYFYWKDGLCADARLK
jgi:hypothetical protein